MDDRAAIEVLGTLEERVAPAHAALLVVDMQNDYCTAGGAGDRSGRDLSEVQAIIPPIRGMVEAARAAGVRVIWAKYTLGPGLAGLSGPEILRRGRNFANADATVKGTWGHEIVDDLPYRREEDLVVEQQSAAVDELMTGRYRSAAAPDSATGEPTSRRGSVGGRSGDGPGQPRMLAAVRVSAGNARGRSSSVPVATLVSA